MREIARKVVFPSAFLPSALPNPGGGIGKTLKCEQFRQERGLNNGRRGRSLAGDHRAQLSAEHLSHVVCAQP
jgi:hypothetical protein